MGTRADFYDGRGRDATWLGSVAWDGYPGGIDERILKTTNQDAFREFVTSFVANRDDGTEPGQGWPWPWEDSGTTDYAYAFDGGKTWISNYGSAWHDEDFEDWDDEAEEEIEPPGLAAEFPDMSGQKHSAPAGSTRSGILLISAPKSDD